MELTRATRTDSEITASEILDTSGLLCPLPVFKASVALEKLEPGQVLEIICTDPGSLADIPALANQTGNRLLRAVVGDGKQTFWLERGERT